MAEETILQILMRRDNMDMESAQAMIDEARDRVNHGEDPEEILLEDFGLEPDYVFELLTGA